AGPPVSEEFGLARREIELGASVESAKGDIEKRRGSSDLRLMIMVITIQHAVGGDLPAILTTLADTMRQRREMREEVWAATARPRPERHRAAARAAADRAPCRTAAQGGRATGEPVDSGGSGGAVPARARLHRQPVRPGSGGSADASHRRRGRIRRGWDCAWRADRTAIGGAAGARRRSGARLLPPDALAAPARQRPARRARGGAAE